MKNALVTGASEGIGAAIAKELASNGYQLYITCNRNIDGLNELKNEIETNFHVPCSAIVCDAGKYDEVEKLFNNLPTLDVLVNNAGISYFGLLTDMSVEDWDRVMHTNLDSCFYTCKLAVPGMVHRKDGCIINISSVWGNVGSCMETAYSASKGGINALTKALAKELAPSNIRVNAIAPGVIDTRMNQCLTAEDREMLRNEIPADRFGTPADVAKLALQIINAPSYMTGQIITIDGGWQ